MDERERIARLLEKAGVDDAQMALLEPVIENVVWMRKKLDEARKLLEKASVTVPYQNGGGQAGIRENPALKAYENLWKAYTIGIGKLTEALPEKDKAAVQAPVQVSSVLARVQERREKS